MTSTAASAGVLVRGRKRKSSPTDRSGSCGLPSAMTAATAVSSCVGCVFLLVSVSTSAWDSVSFDLALVNRTLPATTQRRPLFADAERTQLVGLVIAPTPAATGNVTGTGYCLLNVISSLWTLCDSVNKDEMQNNAMSCCIVVLLCVAASAVTGLIGVLARVVPAIMVTGVLHITAGIFITFSNSIEHEKASRMTRRPQIDVCPQCVCYSLVKTPEQFCNGTYRTVRLGWSVGASWAAAVAYLVASVCWLALTRRVRIEKSKSML